MGTITVNVDDDVEQEFRRVVSEKYGRRKGALGRAFNEAMQAWARKATSLRRCMALLEKGVDLGGLKYAKREELHDRH